jgi:hypothetical protein
MVKNKTTKTKTATLLLDNNALMGDIPDELYLLTSLSRLQVSNNTGLTGKISFAVGRMSNLTSFDASDTSLSGSIPESLFSLTKLQYLDLHRGNFNGRLSQSFALSSLISGAIPAGLAKLSFLRRLLMLSYGNSKSHPPVPKKEY